jgi:membrane protein
MVTYFKNYGAAGSAPAALLRLVALTELRRMRPRPVRPAAYPWRLGGFSVRQLARRVYLRVWEDEILDRAAGLSYYFSFALLPTLLFLTALVGLLPLPDLMGQLLDYADRMLPGDAASLLRKTLAEIVSGASGGLLSIGVFAALWASSSGMLSIMTALNVAYRVRERRHWWTSRLIALGLTIGFSLFTPTALFLLVFGGRIGEALARRVGLGPIFTLAWALLQWPGAIFLALSGLSLVYYLAPAAGRRWHWITPGSIFALAAWLVMSSGLRLYVTYFANYNATYGSIGGVILLMLWLYVSGVALLVGAEIDSAVDEGYGEVAEPPSAPPSTPPASGGKIVMTSPATRGHPGAAS